MLVPLLGQALLASPDAPAADARGKPNVLLIIADDLNCQLGCYDNGAVKTPNLDRLAARGVRFERSYCNYPVCNPSRVSFLSGRYPDTTRVFGNGTDPRVALGKDYQFLPEYFRAHGYYAAGVGKVPHGSFPGSIRWDLFTDPQRGGEVDEQPGKAEAKGGRARRKAVEDGKDRGGGGKAPGDQVPFGGGPSQNSDEQEPDGQTGVRVAKLLGEHSGRGKPFFIAAGFHKPHVPHVAPQRYFDMYPPEQIRLVREPADHAKLIPPIARAPKYYPDLSEAQQRRIIADYYASTTFMDAQVGRLLDAMDRLKLWENTVVVFLGDHGWHLGEHQGFWAKMSVMDESARAPLIVVTPGRKPAVSPRLVEFVDIFPTLTDLCGLPPQPGVEGLSLVPLLDEPQRAWKSAVFSVVSRQGGLGRAVRTDEYTYTEWPDGSRQLYDARKDPKEYFNLAADERHAPVAAEMKAKLTAGWAAARPAAE